MIKPFYLTFFALLLSTQFLLAQKVPGWGGGADIKDVSFGFSFSEVSSYYKIDKTPDWRLPFLDPQNSNQPVTSTLNSISSSASAGFGVGFLARYRISEHLEARLTPSLTFVDKMITYTYVSTLAINKTVSTTAVDFPLSIKLKSDRIDNYRGYLLGGIKYTDAVGSGTMTDANVGAIDKLVKNVKGYGSYEVGIGMDIYFEYFKLSPELKLSNSFGDVLMHDNTAFSSPINKLTLHTLMFSLYFE